MLSLCAGVEALGELALLASRLVLVHDAVRRGLVDLGDGFANEHGGVVGASGDCRVGVLGAGVDLAPNLAVSEVALDRLTVALDLRLDVGHGYLLGRRTGVSLEGSETDRKG